MNIYIKNLQTGLTLSPNNTASKNLPYGNNHDVRKRLMMRDLHCNGRNAEAMGSQLLRYIHVMEYCDMINK